MRKRRHENYQCHAVYGNQTSKFQPPVSPHHNNYGLLKRHDRGVEGGHTHVALAVGLLEQVLVRLVGEGSEIGEGEEEGVVHALDAFGDDG